MAQDIKPSDIRWLASWTSSASPADEADKARAANLERALIAMRAELMKYRRALEGRKVLDWRATADALNDQDYRVCHLEDQAKAQALIIERLEQRLAALEAVIQA